MHFTPTSSSWLNLVERFFAGLTGDVIRAGSFASGNELVRDTETLSCKRNANPKPYKWKAEGAKILSKIKRARVALAGIVIESRFDCLFNLVPNLRLQTKRGFSRFSCS